MFLNKEVFITDTTHVDYFLLKENGLGNMIMNLIFCFFYPLYEKQKS